jgi:hypothetical protein
LDQRAFAQLDEMRQYQWFQPTFDRKKQEHEFLAWHHELPEAPDIELVSPEIGRAVAPYLARGVSPPAPPSPAPYGHLPFTVNTGSQDVFYRWEPYPVSRRVRQASRSVLPNTYAAPQSETPYVPTGFSAVARYALPSLFPACWRWEIQPKPTTIRCGASVPMYGQSGGGVEVMFPAGCTNRGPIANPVVIPAL